MGCCTETIWVGVVLASDSLEVVGIDLPFCVHASSMPDDYRSDKAYRANLPCYLPGNFPVLLYMDILAVFWQSGIIAPTN